MLAPMRQRTIVILVTAFVVSLPMVNVAWSRVRLAGDAAEILADFGPETEQANQIPVHLGYVIFLCPNSKAPVCAASQPPLLFPFGTWVLNNDGRIVWVSSAQLEELRRAAPEVCG